MASNVVEDAGSQQLLSAEPKPRFYAYLYTCMASFNSVLLGFDLGVVAGAILFLKSDMNLTTWEEEWVLSITNWVSIFGCLMITQISDHLGRTKTILCASGLFFVGSLLIAVAGSFGVVLLGRVIVGFGVGTGLSIDPMYIAEISPSRFRGRLVSFSEISINIGIILAYAVNLALDGLPPATAWRWMFAVGCVPALIMVLLSAFCMPDTPRWLLQQGRAAEARAVLDKTCHPQEVEVAMEEIQQQLSDHAHSLPWSAFLSLTPPQRRMVLTAVAIGFTQHLNGLAIVVVYTPTILRDAGFASLSAVLLATLVVGCVKTLFTVAASVSALDTRGRRPFMLLSTAAIAACNLLLSLAVALQWPTSLLVVLLSLYVAAFAVGLGPVTWLMVSEVLPLELRARAMGLATAANRVAAALVGLTFLSLRDALSLAGVFAMYTVLSLVGLAFCYFCLPETKGRTLEEVAALFGAAPVGGGSGSGGGGGVDTGVGAVAATAVVADGGSTAETGAVAVEMATVL